jgi:hypothetical protein
MNLEAALPTVVIGRRASQRPAIAYVDYIIIFVTRPTDFETIHQVLTTYAQASGARLNVTKSQALPVANWTVRPSALGTTLVDNADILGPNF